MLLGTWASTPQKQEDSANVVMQEDSANDVNQEDSANDVKAIPRAAIPREASICSVVRGGGRYHPACGHPA